MIVKQQIVNNKKNYQECWETGRVVFGLEKKNVLRVKMWYSEEWRVALLAGFGFISSVFVLFFMNLCLKFIFKPSQHIIALVSCVLTSEIPTLCLDFVLCLLVVWPDGVDSDRWHRLFPCSRSLLGDVCSHLVLGSVHATVYYLPHWGSE